MNRLIAAGAFAISLAGCAPYPVYDAQGYGEYAPYGYAGGYAGYPYYDSYGPWWYGYPGWWLYGPSVYLGYYGHRHHRPGQWHSDADWHHGHRGPWSGSGRDDGGSNAVGHRAGGRDGSGGGRSGSGWGGGWSGRGGSGGSVGGGGSSGSGGGGGRGR